MPGPNRNGGASLLDTRAALCRWPSLLASQAARSSSSSCMFHGEFLQPYVRIQAVHRAMQRARCAASVRTCMFPPEFTNAPTPSYSQIAIIQPRTLAVLLNPSHSGRDAKTAKGKFFCHVKLPACALCSLHAGTVTWTTFGWNRHSPMLSRVCTRENRHAT